MKKFLVTILAFVYLTVSSGATVHLHYCMGKLFSWGLMEKKDGTCGTCGMYKIAQKGCCHDEHKQVKIEKDQKVSEYAFQYLIKYSDAAQVSLIDLPAVYYASTILSNPSVHAPPRQGTVPIFVLNCNFRI